MYNTHIKCLLFVSNNFSKEFVVDFGGTPYYTHVLLPGCNRRGKQEDYEC